MISGRGGRDGPISRPVPGRDGTGSRPVPSHHLDHIFTQSVSKSAKLSRKIGPYLAIFDERTAREELDTSRWSPNRAGGGRRGRDLTEFIDATARQLHFNRFTGVAMEASNR